MSWTKAGVLGQSRLGAELDDLGLVPFLGGRGLGSCRRPAVARAQIEHVVGTCIAGGERVEGAVVEDVAVLVDLEEGDRLAGGGRVDHRAEVLDVDVDGARDEGGLEAMATESGLMG
jgi:hypothetical protein